MSVALSKPSAKEPETLIDFEVSQLLNLAHKGNYRNFIMIHLALATGLRNDELINITVELVKCFEIVPTILTLPGTIAKGGSPREIPLTPDIRNHLENFLAWKLNFKEDTSPGAYLFVSQHAHKKLNPRDFQRIVSSVSQKSIGRSIHPHVLRHTFATRLLRVSNLEIVRKVLGHKNISTTQVYLHPSTDEISQAVNKIVN